MQDRIRQIDETSCNARPDHTLGQIAEILKASTASFRFTPESRRKRGHRFMSASGQKRTSELSRGVSNTLLIWAAKPLWEGLMKLPRRRFLHMAASAAALPALSHVARAQAYPTRPVRIIVGFAAGGGVDITARLIGQWLSERLGQQFIIENRPGAGTNIATETVVRAPADGYTLLLVNPANAINATLYDKLNFNFIRDIAPVAGIMRVPNVMEVNPSVPAKTVPEFIAYAKANPGKVNMASGGTEAESTCGRRVVQDDDWRRHGSRAVSRRLHPRSPI